MENIAKMPTIIKVLSSVLGAAAGFLWGEVDGLMIALIAFIVLDYISGVLVGASKHKLNSQTSFKGLCKKAMILLIVAVAHIVDKQILGGTSSVFRSATCGLYIASEGLSIMENAGKLGVPFPKKLREMLEQLHNKSEEDGK